MYNATCNATMIPTYATTGTIIVTSGSITTDTGNATAITNVLLRVGPLITATG